MLVRAVGTSWICFSSSSEVCATGTYSAMSTVPVRNALARAVPSATNFTSTPGAFAFRPQ